MIAKKVQFSYPIESIPPNQEWVIMFDTQTFLCFYFICYKEAFHSMLPFRSHRNIQYEAKEFSVPRSLQDNNVKKKTKILLNTVKVIS